jgi:hypothetical protein
MRTSLLHAERIPIESAPTLSALVDEVERSGEPKVLVRDGADVAVISPAPRRTKKRRKTGILKPDDPLFGLFGIGDSGIPGGMSSDKYKYFEEAFLHDRE